MDDMREIVTVEQMDRLFLVLAIVVPIVGAVIGGWMGRRSNAGRGALKGFLIGLLGPLNLVLWKVYNALTDRMGLDSVKNLLVQLGLFVALGVVAGLSIGFMARQRPATEGPNGNQGGSPVTAGGPDPSRSPGLARSSDESREPPRDA